MTTSDRVLYVVMSMASSNAPNSRHMRVRVGAGERDARLLPVFGLDSGDFVYSLLSTTRKKFIQFCVAQHTTVLPLLPPFPVRLASLIRYGWWLQFHGVEGGMGTIRNYTTAVCEWSKALSHPDPRDSEPWVWKKFRCEGPKFLEVVNVSQAKVAMQPEWLRAMNMNADLEDLTQLEDQFSDALGYFSTVRPGHLHPNSYQEKDMVHLMQWKHLHFEGPSLAEAERLVCILDSTKTRVNDPWWTAVGRNDEFPSFCAVRLGRLWRYRTYSGDPEQYVFARSGQHRPTLRSEYIRRLRTRLRNVAPSLGISDAEFDPKRWSAISFRKGGLSALAKHVQPHELAMHADHKSVETTRRYYLSHTTQARAAHTTLMSRGFAVAAPWSATVELESVWADSSRTTAY